MHADQPILTVRGLHKRFGSLVVAADVQLDVHPYRLHSLIGPNGAGKTTFFNMLTGLLRADAGRSYSPARTSPACRCTGAFGSASAVRSRSSACSAS